MTESFRNIGAHDHARTAIIGGVGAEVFTDLTDVPAAYTGQGGKGVAVKNSEDGLEFVDFPSSVGWFNVMDYGALGDDSTNDYTAIAAAITAMWAAGGGVLYFPMNAASGKYRHGTRIQVQSPTNRLPVIVLCDAGVRVRPTADIDSFYVKADNSGNFTDISNNVLFINVFVEPVTAHQAAGFHIEDSFNTKMINCRVFNANKGVILHSHDSWCEGNDLDVEIDQCNIGIDFFTDHVGTGSFQRSLLKLFIRTASGGKAINVDAGSNLYGTSWEVQLWPVGNNTIGIDMAGNGNHSIWHGIVDLAGGTPTPGYALKIESTATNLDKWQFDVEFAGTYNGGNQESGAVENASVIAWEHGTLPYGGSTVHNFTDLGDVPSSYSGEAGKVVVVNSGETALEFIDFPASTGKYRAFVYTNDNPFAFVTDSDGQPVYILADLE